MAIYQLIACTIIANDILKASVYFGTEVFRTEILRCVTQFVKQKKCFLIVRFGVQMLCIDEHSFACKGQMFHKRSHNQRAYQRISADQGSILYNNHQRSACNQRLMA